MNHTSTRGMGDKTDIAAGLEGPLINGGDDLAPSTKYER